MIPASVLAALVWPGDLLHAPSNCRSSELPSPPPLPKSAAHQELHDQRLKPHIRKLEV
jgi:hypothetical protein